MLLWSMFCPYSLFLLLLQFENLNHCCHCSGYLLYYRCVLVCLDHWPLSRYLIISMAKTRNDDPEKNHSLTLDYLSPRLEVILNPSAPMLNQHNSFVNAFSIQSLFLVSLVVVMMKTMLKPSSVFGLVVVLTCLYLFSQFQNMRICLFFEWKTLFFYLVIEEQLNNVRHIRALYCTAKMSMLIICSNATMWLLQFLKVFVTSSTLLFNYYSLKCTVRCCCCCCRWLLLFFSYFLFTANRCLSMHVLLTYLLSTAYCSLSFQNNKRFLWMWSICRLCSVIVLFLNEFCDFEALVLNESRCLPACLLPNQYEWKRNKEKIALLLLKYFKRILLRQPFFYLSIAVDRNQYVTCNHSIRIPIANMKFHFYETICNYYYDRTFFDPNVPKAAAENSICIWNANAHIPNSKH